MAWLLLERVLAGLVEEGAHRDAVILQLLDFTDGRLIDVRGRLQLGGDSTGRRRSGLQHVDPPHDKPVNRYDEQQKQRHPKAQKLLTQILHPVLQMVA